MSGDSPQSDPKLQSARSRTARSQSKATQGQKTPPRATTRTTRRTQQAPAPEAGQVISLATPMSEPQTASSPIASIVATPKSMTNTAINTTHSDSEITLNVAGIRPIAASPVEVVETVNMAGIRPIIASGLAIQDTVNIAGIRPIVNDGLEIVEEVNIMGIRPITASQIQVADTINLMGARPIAYSGLQITEMMSVAGLRPVASNEIDDSATLMGFLD